MKTPGHFWLRLALFGLLAVSVFGAEPSLTRLRNAVLVEHAGNDADSFAVEAEGRALRIRLYFVDAPESEASWNADVRRVREQMRYFGLPDEKKVIEYGRQAAERVQAKLAQPFEVYTSFAAALGRSSEGRVYAFVRTADGKDLGEWLVKEGLARVSGVGRETPEGTRRDEMQAHLADLEAAAMLKRSGVWASSDSDRLVELRAEQRREDDEIKAIQRHLNGKAQPAFPLNINSCAARDLEAVQGIGPTLARRIVETRPHPNLEDLLKIHGIRPAHVEKWREFLTAE